MIRFWYPDREVAALADVLDPEIKRVRYAGDFILRKDVEEFEKNFAAYVGTKYAVGVASGTDAIMLSLIAAGLKPGDLVSVPAYTFRATLEAVVHAGGVPVLYDMDGKTIQGVPFVIPAHLEGELCYPDEVPGAIMIEDSAQAIGAGPVRGIAACYSFYPAKILGCEGDGGAIATNDEALAIKLRKMRNHYKEAWKEGYGFNSRLDNVQAAILNVKLKHLPDYIKGRKLIAEQYDAELTEAVGRPTSRAVYQDYIITVPDPISLQQYLEVKGIQTMLNVYPFPVSKPQKAAIYEHTTLRLPCTPYHTSKEIDQVIAAINEFYD